MKYERVVRLERFGIIDFCNFLTGANELNTFNFYWPEISKVDLYNYVKIKTENFQPALLKFFIEELRESVNDLEFLMPNSPRELQYGRIYYTIERPSPFFPEIELKMSFAVDKTLRERVEFLSNAIPNLVFRLGVKKLFQLSDIAEQEYQRVSELGEIEENLNVNKTKLNRRQKVALLESTGVLKYLETNVFAGNQTKIAEYLSLLLELNQQNIRKEISGATELLLSDPKITKVINPILSDLGLMCKE